MYKAQGDLVGRTDDSEERPSTSRTDPRPGSLAHALQVSDIGRRLTGTPWAVFPIRNKRPFAGSHGFKDASSDAVGIRDLWERYRGANGVGIATGKVSGVWVLDVDIKDGHAGDESLYDLEKANGALPETVQVVTGSGGMHYYFAYEGDVRGSQGTLGDGLDVRSDGGYIIAAGSQHDTSRTLYVFEVEHHPSTVAIVAAPAWLVEQASSTRAEGAVIVGSGELATMVDKMIADGWKEMASQCGSRRFSRPGVGHESARWYPPDEWWPEGRLTIFTTSVPEGHWLKKGTFGPRAEDPGVQMFAELEAFLAEEASNARPEDRAPRLPGEFWEARPVLAQIRQAAWSRQRSAPAVLAAVLARTAASVDYHIKLPPIVGAEAPVCFFAALVAPPAAGKSSANDVAADLLPYDNCADIADQLPIGSGEGIVEALFGLVAEDNGTGKKVNVKRQVRYNAFVYVDEGEMLGAIGGRQGSSLLPTLRSIWSGKTIGQTNASEDRKRIVPKGKYVYGMVVGLQESRSGPLLADAGAGTPQRFLWARAVDPDIPDNPPPWPGEIDWKPPTLAAASTTAYMKVADEVAREIRHDDLAVSQGKVTLEEMGGHGNLLRLKVAALLGLLDNRWSVTQEDWSLAGQIKHYSDQVRAHAEAVIRTDSDRKERSSTTKAATRAVAIEQATERDRVERCAQKIAARVESSPGMTVKENQQRAHEPAAVFHAALEHAFDNDWIEQRDEPGQGAEKRALYPLRPPAVVLSR